VTANLAHRSAFNCSPVLNLPDVIGFDIYDLKNFGLSVWFGAFPQAETKFCPFLPWVAIYQCHDE
jgi:hypothetical protein